MKFIKICLLLSIMSVCFAQDRYFVTLEFKKSSFSLSISKHVSNAMNAFQMQIPTDKEFYDACNINQEIESNFNQGSLLLKGEFSSYKITVVNKEVRK